MRSLIICMQGILIISEKDGSVISVGVKSN